MKRVYLLALVALLLLVSGCLRTIPQQDFDNIKATHMADFLERFPNADGNISLQFIDYDASRLIESVQPECLELEQKAYWLIEATDEENAATLAVLVDARTKELECLTERGPHIIPPEDPTAQVRTRSLTMAMRAQDNPDLNITLFDVNLAEVEVFDDNNGSWRALLKEPVIVQPFTGVPFYATLPYTRLPEGAYSRVRIVIQGVDAEIEGGSVPVRYPAVPLELVINAELSGGSALILMDLNTVRSFTYAGQLLEFHPVFEVRNMINPQTFDRKGLLDVRRGEIQYASRVSFDITGASEIEHSLRLEEVEALLEEYEQDSLFQVIFLPESTRILTMAGVKRRSFFLDPETKQLIVPTETTPEAEGEGETPSSDTACTAVGAILCHQSACPGRQADVNLSDANAICCYGICGEAPSSNTCSAWGGAACNEDEQCVGIFSKTEDVFFCCLGRCE